MEKLTLEEATFKMNEAKELKNKAIRHQKWEDAADARDIERKYERIVKELSLENNI